MAALERMTLASIFRNRDMTLSSILRNGEMMLLSIFRNGDMTLHFIPGHVLKGDMRKNFG